MFIFLVSIVGDEEIIKKYLKEILLAITEDILYTLSIEDKNKGY